MYVRLAFAVAAHLEAEILAIDEVLAVGDSEFQSRSLAKMREVAADGRTVLYVSHQLATVSALCTSAFYLESGRLRYHGDVADRPRPLPGRIRGLRARAAGSIPPPGDRRAARLLGRASPAPARRPTACGPSRSTCRRATRW